MPSRVEQVAAPPAAARIVVAGDFNCEVRGATFDALRRALGAAGLQHLTAALLEPRGGGAADGGGASPYTANPRDEVPPAWA